MARRSERAAPRIPGALLVIGLAVLVAAVALPFGYEPPEATRIDGVHLALARLRAAIRNYATEHAEWPGQHGGWQLREQLVGRTDAEGLFGEGEAFPLGPYLQGDLPPNPAGGGRSIAVVDVMPDEPAGQAAWIYCRATGEIRPDSTARTGDGRRLFDL